MSQKTPSRRKLPGPCKFRLGQLVVNAEPRVKPFEHDRVVYDLSPRFHMYIIDLYLLDVGYFGHPEWVCLASRNPNAQLKHCAIYPENDLRACTGKEISNFRKWLETPYKKGEPKRVITFPKYKDLHAKLKKQKDEREAAKLFDKPIGV